MIENNMLCNPSPFDGSHRTGPVSLAGWAGVPASLGHPWHRKYLRNPCSLVGTFSGSSSEYVNPLCPRFPYRQVKEPQNSESTPFMNLHRKKAAGQHELAQAIM